LSASITVGRRLGDLRRLRDDYPAAAQTHEEALGTTATSVTGSARPTPLATSGTSIASSWDEAHALAGLGRCALAAGHATQAQVLLRQALEIFQRIGAAETPDLLAELDALTGPPPAQ
jgi:hypothetical protein